MSLWPQPTYCTFGSTVVFLSPAVTLNIDCVEEDPCLSAEADPPASSQEDTHSARRVFARRVDEADVKRILSSAFERFRTYALTQNFVPRKFHPPRTDFEPNLGTTSPSISKVKVKVCTAQSTSSGPEDQHWLSERYTLLIEKDGLVSIAASSYVGALHGLTTLSQLFYRHSTTAELAYTTVVPVQIYDRPRYLHRGFSLDISRNFISTEMVKRILEGLSYCKMSHLHLHAWDSQSWPVEIPALPELAKKGAYHESQIWSVSDLESVQRYGFERGIEVYFDADMPGHTASIHHAYPELIVAYNKQPWKQWCLEPPSGQLKLQDPRVYSFLDTLFGDLLPRVRAWSSHLQVGGEEINQKVYELEDAVATSSKEGLGPLLQKFMDYVIAQAKTYQLTPIVWEEALLEWDLQLPSDTVIQAWKSDESLPAIVSRGYRGLAGTSTHWYLDAGRGTWLDPDPNNPATPIKQPFVDWNSPYKSWRQVYSYDPLHNVPDDKAHLVLGGECFMWGEQADESNMDVLLWPRVSAAAEVLWSGKGEIGEDATMRIAQLRERMIARGYQAEVVQMEWCLRNPHSTLL